MRRGCSFGGFDGLAGSGWSLGACLGTFWGVSWATLMITSAMLASLESMLNYFSQYAESKKQKLSQDGTTWLRKCSQKAGSKRGPSHPGIEILIWGGWGLCGAPSAGQRLNITRAQGSSHVCPDPTLKPLEATRHNDCGGVYQGGRGMSP